MKRIWKSSRCFLKHKPHWCKSNCIQCWLQNGFTRALLILIIVASSLFQTNIAKAADPIVLAGGYVPISSGAADWWSGGTAGHFLNNNNNQRIRQNGIVDHFRFYTVNLTGMNHFYIEIWRKNSTTGNWTQLYAEDVISQIASSANNTVTPSSSWLVQEGDYVGYSTNQTVALMWGRKTSGFQAKSTYYTTTSVNSTSSHNWDAESQAAQLLPIEVYMVSPDVVFVGDSIVAGAQGTRSFIEDYIGSNITYGMEYQFSQIDPAILNKMGFSANSVLTYQNMGIVSQSTGAMWARYTNDVVNLHPKLVIINGGINNINGEYGLPVFISDITNMLNTDNVNGFRSIVLQVTPFTSANTSDAQHRDQYNAALIPLLATYNATALASSQGIGQFRVGGDAGNLWDLIPAYKSDDTHPNNLGYGVLAQSLFNSLMPSVTTGAVTASGTTATLNGNVTNMGVTSSTYRYFEYWVGSGAVQTTPLVAQVVTGTYSIPVTVDTNKEIRARAVVQVGSVKSYGSIVTFSTQSNTWGLFLASLISLILAGLLFWAMIRSKANLLYAFLIALSTFLVIQALLMAVFG